MKQVLFFTFTFLGVSQRKFERDFNLGTKCNVFFYLDETSKKVKAICKMVLIKYPGLENSQKKKKSVLIKCKLELCIKTLY